MRIVKRNRFKNLGELHKEWTEAGVKASRAHHTQTCQGIWLQFVIRGVLPGLRRRRTGLLPSGPKSSFQMRASFVFHLETRDPRVWRNGGEAHSPSCLKSSVKFPQSVMIWGCNVICWCWSIVFFENQRHCTRLPRKCWSTSCFPSADQLFKDADFIFQQDLAPAHTAKSTKNWLNDMVLVCLDWPAKLTRPEPYRESMGYCQEENEKQETKKCRWAEGHCQRNLGFHTTSAVPQTDHLHATPNWGSN